MKFTDGYWQLRPGVTASHPAQIHEVESDATSLTIHAPTKRLNHRGDTLDGATLSIKFSSPMPDVVRVTFRHWAGVARKGPAFQIHEQPTTVSITNDDSAASFTSGALSVRVPKSGPWHVDFLAGERLLTTSEPKGLGAIQYEGTHYLHEQLSLGVGENVYGLGERFSAFVKNGQVVDIWNEDGGTASEQTYKNIPFYLTNRGYGVFVNHSEKVSFEVASEKVERVQFSVPGHVLEYFVIYGPTPKDILEKYTALTGRPALPPAWSFGLWLTTSFTTSYDEATVTNFIQGMADRSVPLHVFHFDCFWMKEYNWCDFRWDPRTFPDPEAMLKRLKARGLHICVWINPYIGQRSPLFAEGVANGYLLKKPNGDVWQIDKWQAGMGIVDFTNPAACQWYGDKLRALVAMGVDCFKTDFGERIPTDVVYFDGSSPEQMHNYYSYLYNQTVFDVLQEQRGAGEAVVFARSATAGGQQFPVHWGGDSESTFRSMAESLRGGLSLSLSGFGFWSHDIGGFEGTPPAEIYKRWVAFGLLSSHSRLHGSSSYRVPWVYDDEAVDVLRFFTRLKCTLMPYLYGQAQHAVHHGWPMLRAMLLEFPNDPACEYLDRQYMLGDSLLVAPVFSGPGDVSYYLPTGRWTNYFTNQAVEGGHWVNETHNFMSLPLFVRPNTLLPIGANPERPDYDYTDGLTLRLYSLEDGHQAQAVIPALSGQPASTITAHRSGQTITITCQGTLSNWSFQLINLGSASSVQGGALNANTITPSTDSTQLTITGDFI